MISSLITTGILAAALLLSAPIFLRSMKQMRAGDENWRRRWRALEPRRRRAIIRTMRKGQPVRDPEDAELALRAVAQIEHVRRAMRPIERISAIVLIALLVTAIISGEHGLAIIAGAGLAISGLLDVVSRQRRRQLLRSADATRQLKP